MPDLSSPGDPAPLRSVRLVSAVSSGAVALLGVLLVAAGALVTSIYLFPVVLPGGAVSREGFLPENLVAAAGCLVVTSAGFFLAPGVRFRNMPVEPPIWGVIAAGIAFWVAGAFGVSGRGAFGGNGECGIEGCWPDQMQDVLIGVHLFAVGMVAVAVGSMRVSSRVQRYAPVLALIVVLLVYHLLWAFLFREFLLGPAPAWYL
jgi:hypothetical protein